MSLLDVRAAQGQSSGHENCTCRTGARGDGGGVRPTITAGFPKSGHALPTGSRLAAARRRAQRGGPRPVHAAERGLPWHAAHLLGLRAGAARRRGARQPDGVQRRPGVQEHGRRSARAQRARQPDLPARDSGDDCRLHQSRPPAGSARTDAAELGRSRHQSAHRVQLARRSLCARHRRRAAAGAVEGVQHLERSRAPRHRRRELRRDRRLHRRLATPRRVPQGHEHDRQLRQSARRPRLRRHHP